MYPSQIEASPQALRSFPFLAKVAFFALTFFLASFALPYTGLCAPIGETGTIHGTVKDPSGAVIPGATVTVTNLATNDEVVQRTTGEGVYSFSVRAPGAYVVTTSTEGFQTQRTERVVVDPGANISLDVSLKVVRPGGEGAGSTIFGNYCETCHGNPKVASAPAPAILKQMSPERIYLALTKGDMVTIAQNLTDVQKRDIAEWVEAARSEPRRAGTRQQCPMSAPAILRSKV